MITIRTYEAWILDTGQTRDDAQRLEAIDHEDAACQCVENYERRNAEYMVGAGEVSVTVAVALAGCAPQHYSVTGYTRPHYYATPAKEVA
ncbi:hypothetical protein [Castellaniella sp. S9]|uniref:hypothetical protein n=1 Tax=Castellaniella sp. S9 TaxID=2993652 RepID=UPI0022B5240F|nr:hypothetical protein [Castellaniella sp. S9]